MCRHVRALLVFGTTGDGWELTDAEKREVLGFYAARAGRLGLRMLVGCLKPDADAVRTDMEAVLRIARNITGAGSAGEAFSRAGICGFAVCPPHGEGLPQERILSGLDAVLRAGHPVALYQLPQVTRNEMAPATLRDLASRHPGFYMFKDSSGNDAAVKSGLLAGEVFCVRGMEGGYGGWFGPGRLYDGYLLSMANVMAPELARMIGLLEAGRAEEAEALSRRIEAVMGELHGIVAAIPEGNRFANSVKAMDHFLAWGKGAMDAPPPRLHAGTSIPEEALHRTRQVLAAAGIGMDEGYMEG